MAWYRTAWCTVMAWVGFKVEELVSGREREEMDRRQEARRIASLREIRLQVRLRQRLRLRQEEARDGR